MSSNSTSEFQLSSVFGRNVLTLDKIRSRLHKCAFEEFASHLKSSSTVRMSKETADAIAHVARTWATEQGATHYTHWFQPLTDSTAEKHDSFLGINSKGQVIDAFSGNQLIQAEPDASSFPNGGARTTFEARGYTVWDITSPMFVQETPNKLKTLYIPSVFIRYTGEALDEKTVLLRSCEAVNRETVAALGVLNEYTKE